MYGWSPVPRKKRVAPALPAGRRPQTRSRNSAAAGTSASSSSTLRSLMPEFSHFRELAVKRLLAAGDAVDVVVGPHDGGGAIVLFEPGGKLRLPNHPQPRTAVLWKQRAVRRVRPRRDEAAFQRRNQVLPRHRDDPAAGFGEEPPV